MACGRIEAYLHSDATTPNKGGAMIRVTSSTDFASRGEDFAAFARKAVRLAYAANAATWNDVTELYPEAENEPIALDKHLRENISVSEIVILRV